MSANKNPLGIFKVILLFSTLLFFHNALAQDTKAATPQEQLFLADTNHSLDAFTRALKEKTTEVKSIKVKKYEESWLDAFSNATSSLFNFDPGKTSFEPEKRSITFEITKAGSNLPEIITCQVNIYNQRNSPEKKISLSNCPDFVKLKKDSVWAEGTKYDEFDTMQIAGQDFRYESTEATLALQSSSNQPQPFKNHLSGRLYDREETRLGGQNKAKKSQSTGQK